MSMISIACCLALGALTWYPSADWEDEPDPIADPRARKGGTVRFSGAQPPKSFNAYVDNNSYTRMTFDLMYENLIGVDSSTLEFVPSLARRWAVSEDGNEFVFVIDGRAHWSDGRPVTAHDVKWTFDTVVAPTSDTGPWKTTLAAFESPIVEDERTVRFRKKAGSAKDWRDVMHCGMFWVLPSHFFGGKDFNKLDLEGAVVGGAYRISRVEEQVETELSRVDGWWRRDLIGCRGVCNFDRIVLRYHADLENAFEALKKMSIDVYPVYTARIMAQEARGEKFDRNWILKRRVRNHRPAGFQGFAMNVRRKPFDDLRVRQAMSHLIDRATMNRTMMYNEYFMLNSYYPDIYDASAPCGNKLFDFDVEKAKALLSEAGLGGGFSFTFLSRSSSEDKFLALFDHALRSCGISMRIERKDFAGWMRDMDGFNFDMTWASWGSSIFKNPETMWLSSEADRRGSSNITGFRSSKVDRIIAAEKTMGSVKEREAAYKGIDELVAAESPYALLWGSDSTRILYWNKFGMPKTVLSRYSDEEAVLTYWWYDEDRAAELEEAIKNHTCLPDVPEDVVFDEVFAK